MFQLHLDIVHINNFEQIVPISNLKTMLILEVIKIEKGNTMDKGNAASHLSPALKVSLSLERIFRTSGHIESGN